MAFWGTQASADSDTNAAPAQSLEQTQHAVVQARRRLLGAAVLLALACALIPWMLDSAPRAWGDDVILRMPKSEQPYQAKPDSKPATAKPAAEVKP
jgi:cell division septation protein DedD